MYSTSIIFNDSKRKYYVGHSSEMNERLNRHNSHLVQSAKYGVSWKLIHKEIFETRVEAVCKEKQIKSVVLPDI